MPSFGLIAMPLLGGLLAALLIAARPASAVPPPTPPTEEEDEERRRELEQLFENANTAADLARRLEELRAALEELNEKTRELDEAARERELQTLMLGNYSGPYVLLECHAAGATVYPGAWEIASNPEGEQRDRLFEQIKRAGFVALAVRPGAFEETFNQIHDVVMAHAKRSGTGLSFFPIQAIEPLDPYLPEGEE